MDFKELLDVADYNREEAKHETSVKRYSTLLPPPKKVPKSGVQSDNIRRFLEKKKAEEEAKAAEAQKQKEQLLALRAQNSKNSKKAKIMASRTKDNDFSKIKLTEDEIEAKKKREAELQRQHLANKVERMKARIEMEEREKLMPRKRKRKSKNPEVTEVDEDPCLDEKYQNGHRDSSESTLKYHDRISSNKFSSEKNNAVKRLSRPPAPAMSFADLLKVAEKKQYEPIEIPVKKKEEERLMTKKERKLMELELAKQKRRQEMLNKGIQPTIYGNSQQSSVTPKNNSSGKGSTKSPVVIHIEKDPGSKSLPEPPKFKNPKSVKEAQSMKHISNTKPVNQNINKIQSSMKTNSAVSHEKNHKVSVSQKASSTIVSNSQKILSNSIPNVQKTSSNTVANLQKSPSNVINSQKSTSKQYSQSPVREKNIDIKKKIILQKKNSTKIAPISSSPVKQTVPVPTIDTDAIAKGIEQRLREQLEQKIKKELEEKFAAQFGLNVNKDISENQPVKNMVSDKKASEKCKPSNESKKIQMPVNGKTVPKVQTNRPLASKAGMETSSMKQKASSQKGLEKKPFHKNPYLDPPRRLLEPQRPPKPPPKRRIESDDEDDDDDMSDFIDDGPSQNDENYSEYIKEIFGYDRNRYIDDDDEDIPESSFAEQMKEEVRSAKLGYLEDLEEERKLQEMERRKKKKLKK
ncbi:protein SPT2 homolog [Stegodyphus dumicola]|uniref:protein SPT2 homolog n=1 Tax=Stegodyphus dumicola TaxID=202533 RepID=UPI0015A97937|nr:protein SPT2 homolog [Stegodyphus dumicola]